VRLTDSPSCGQPPKDVMIRRAEIAEIETVHDAVWKLATSSPGAAHWARATFYPYIATESTSGALQAKALFLACVTGATPFASQTGGDHPISLKISPMDRIVGFAAFSAIMTIGGGESTVENMAVDPLWQRSGVGRRLLTAGLHWCRAHAAGTVFLEVRASNRAAIALYERVGFSAIGNRPGYYRDPAEDGLQMRKTLDRVTRAG